MAENNIFNTTLVAYLEFAMPLIFPLHSLTNFHVRLH